MPLVLKLIICIKTEIMTHQFRKLFFRLAEATTMRVKNKGGIIKIFSQWPKIMKSKVPCFNLPKACIYDSFNRPKRQVLLLQEELSKRMNRCVDSIIYQAVYVLLLDSNF